jgi:hypothetical protein
MPVRKQVLATLVTSVLALAVFASGALAQCSNPGTGGSNRIVISVANDGGSTPVATSYDFDLFTRFRISTLTMFSWGRGPAGHPGTVRSSYAVLRERLGLKR